MKRARRLEPRAMGRVWRRLSNHLSPHRRSLAAALCCMIGSTALELARPWPLKLAFDLILIPVDGPHPLLTRYPALETHPQLLLGMLAGAVLLIAIGSGLLGFGQTYLTASVGQRVVADIRLQVYAHLQRLSQSFHDQSSTGDLISRLTGDIRMMRELLVNSLVFILDRLLVVACMLAVMLWMDWRLTCVALVVLPILGLTVRRFGQAIKGATRKQRRRESQITHAIHEGLSTLRVVQALAREAHAEERFASHNDRSVKASLKATRLQAQMNRIVQVLLAAGTAAVMWLGVQRVQASALSAGDLLVFTAYMTALYKPVRKLASLTSRLSKAAVCGERLVAILDTEPEIRDAVDARVAPPFRGAIELEDVSFSYPGRSSVLDGANLTIAPGQTVALIGESGVGKSTLAALLLRFYDPLRGSVRIDGDDLRAYTLQSLRSQIAILLQEPALFNATVQENIGYGKLDADLDEVIAAARVADAHDFIERLPLGYDTVLSEGGRSLSGGQRQRIAIARAVLQDAPIVILDELTTGLDNRSANQVERALAQLTADRTCLRITHDLTCAQCADQVVRLSDGQLLSVGEISAEAANA